MPDPARLSIDESQRLRVLEALAVLDSEAEPLFTTLAGLAADVCATPIAILSLITADRLWVKASVGLAGVRDIPRELAFCAYTIGGDQLFEIPDTLLDPRFASNPFVRDEPHLRYYAGVPLDLGGARVGALAVFDLEPRMLTARQRARLAELAIAAAQALALRRDALAYRDAAAAATRAEERLATERQRLADVIDGMQAGTWEWNVQTGETRFNERWAEIIGYTLAEISPVTMNSWLDVAHPEDIVAAGERMQSHFLGSAPYYDSVGRVRHRDGHWVWALDRGRIVTRTPDGQPEWVFGTHIDISALKATEHALRQALSFNQRIERAAGVGGWELDIESGRLTWTDETRRIHEVAPDYAPDVPTAIAFYPPEAQPFIRRAIDDALGLGAPWDLELPLVTATGRAIWVRAVGAVEYDDDKPARLVGAFQDVTERRAILSALAESHENLRVTLDAIGAAVLTTDGEGHITWLNPACEQMIGWSGDEAIGRPLADVARMLDPETHQPFGDPLALARSDEVRPSVMRGVLVARDGSERLTVGTLSPIRTLGHDFMGVVIAFLEV